MAIDSHDGELQGNPFLSYQDGGEAVELLQKLSRCDSPIKEGVKIQLFYSTPSSPDEPCADQVIELDSSTDKSDLKRSV